MRILQRIAPIVLTAAAAASVATAAEVLTAADVEKVAHVSPVKLTEKNPSKGAGGDLNFTGPDGKLLVMVRVYKSGGYEKLKKMYFAGDVKDVGDEAFSAPPGMKTPYVLYFRKGTAAGSVTTYLNRDGTPKLSIEQLADLGRVVASRM